MKNWKIPITYAVCAIIEIEADCLDDAMQIAQDSNGEQPLPKDSEYVDGSWYLSTDDAGIIRECYNHSQQDDVHIN